MNTVCDIEQKKRPRNSNIELYRIVVMLLIVTHHYVVNSGLDELMMKRPTEASSIFLYLIGMWGKTGINCFVLITGYFMCRQNLTLRRFLSLTLEVIFYNFVITLIFMLSGYTEFSINKLVWFTLPVKTIGDSFVDSFLLFLLFIPFINVLINNLIQKQHLMLLVLCLFCYTIIPTFSLIPNTPAIVVRINYITWFYVVYIIGSYIRIYPFKYKNSLKFWGIASFVSIIISVGSVMFFIYYYSKGENGELINPFVYKMVSDSNAIFAVIVSVCLCFFLNIKMRTNKIINTMAASTFGVLLIHGNSDIMRQWLWTDIFNNVKVLENTYTHTYIIYIHALLVPVLVFFISLSIDYMRKSTIEKPILDFVEQKTIYILMRVKKKFL